MYTNKKHEQILKEELEKQANRLAEAHEKELKCRLEDKEAILTEVKKSYEVVISHLNESFSKANQPSVRNDVPGEGERDPLIDGIEFDVPLPEPTEEELAKRERRGSLRKAYNVMFGDVR